MDCPASYLSLRGPDCLGSDGIETLGHTPNVLVCVHSGLRFDDAFNVHREDYCDAASRFRSRYFAGPGGFCRDVRSDAGMDIEDHQAKCTRFHEEGIQ